MLLAFVAWLAWFASCVLHETTPHFLTCQRSTRFGHGANVPVFLPVRGQNRENSVLLCLRLLNSKNASETKFERNPAIRDFDISWRGSWGSQTPGAELPFDRPEGVRGRPHSQDRNQVSTRGQFDSFDRIDIRVLKVSLFLSWYEPKAFSISRLRRILHCLSFGWRRSRRRRGAWAQAQGACLYARKRGSG
jgi:hypothetical protein